MAGEWSDGTLFSDGTGWSDGAAAATTRTLQHRRWLYWPTPAAGTPVNISYAPLALIQPQTVLGRAVWGTDVGNTDIGGASSVICAYIGVAPISGSFNHLTVWFITSATEFAYSAGNGGTIRCSIQTVDGSNNPTGTLIGGSVDYSPGLVNGHWVGSGKTQIQAQFPDLTLSSPAALTAGQKFAMVFQNVHASPAANYVGLDHLLQWAGGGDTGMGFNSPDLDPVWDHKQKIGAGAWQSRRGTAAGNAHYSLPIFVLRDSTSGNYIAQTFMADLDGKILGGTAVARQLFVPPTTVTVDRAYIMIARQVVGCTSFRLGITLGSATTEAYLNSNTAFADTNISALPVQFMVASPANQDEENTEYLGRSVLVTFPAPITLTGGVQYALLVSTPTATGIHVHGCGVGSSWWAGRHADPFGGLAQSGTVSSFSTWTNTDARLPIYLLQGTAAPPAALPLDALTAGLVMPTSSHRRLLTSYTGPLIQVQRTTPDTTTLDIGYDANNKLDEAAIAAFCTTGDGEITRVYFQDGSGNYLRPTFAKTRIYIVGVMQKSGNIPVEKCGVGANYGYASAALASSITGATMSCYVGRSYGAAVGGDVSVGLARADGWSIFGTDSITPFYRPGSTSDIEGYRNNVAINTPITIPAGYFVAGGRLTGTDFVMYANGTSNTTASPGTLAVTHILRGNYHLSNGGGNHSDNSLIGEVVVWSGDIGDTAINAAMANYAAFMAS